MTAAPVARKGLRGDDADLVFRTGRFFGGAAFFFATVFLAPAGWVDFRFRTDLQRTALRSPVKRFEKLEQGGLILRPAIFIESLAQRELPEASGSMKPGSITRHEGKSIIRVTLVFRQMHGDPANPGPLGGVLMQK